MQDTEYFNGIPAQTVYNEKRQAGKHQLPGSGPAPGAAAFWKLCELVNRLVDS
jgi:hypothetical protein